jgi:hypothetical protein
MQHPPISTLPVFFKPPSRPGQTHHTKNIPFPPFSLREAAQKVLEG